MGDEEAAREAAGGASGGGQGFFMLGEAVGQINEHNLPQWRVRLLKIAKDIDWAINSGLLERLDSFEDLCELVETLRGSFNAGRWIGGALGASYG